MKPMSAVQVWVHAVAITRCSATKPPQSCTIPKMSHAMSDHDRERSDAENAEIHSIASWEDAMINAAPT